MKNLYIIALLSLSTVVLINAEGFLENVVGGTFRAADRVVTGTGDVVTGGAVSRGKEEKALGRQHKREEKELKAQQRAQARAEKAALKKQRNAQARTKKRTESTPISDQDDKMYIQSDNINNQEGMNRKDNDAMVIAAVEEDED